MLHAKKPFFDAQKYATMTITVEEIKEIKQAFDIFDSDLSGAIDPQELKQAFIELGFTGQNKFVYQILAELDQDGKGEIDFPEFLKLATAKIGEKDSRAQINKVFASFDSQKRGKINVDDLARISQELGEEMSLQDIKKMFDKADLDDDGFVTPEDFYNIMTHRVYWDN